MDAPHLESAERVRARLGERDPAAFRAALLGVPPLERDAWLDRVLGLGELPDDGPELPRDGVPYLPCPVDALLRLVDAAGVTGSDVVVDVGSGVGRAAAALHLLSGARVVGLEVQPPLVAAARALAARLPGAPLTFVEGDAARLAAEVPGASVYFLYCPFSGERLARLLAGLEPLARSRPLRIGTVDLPLPALPWLRLQPQQGGDLAIYRSTAHEAGPVD